MNARQRKRAARRAAQQQAAPDVKVTFTQPEPEPEPVKPAEKTPFEKVTWRLRGGFTVTITGPKAFEEDIYVEAQSESIVIMTGERIDGHLTAQYGRALRTAEIEMQARTAPRPVQRTSRPTPRGNASTFRSSSSLPIDAPIGSLPGEQDDEPEEPIEDDGPRMQENGMPKAPRDRTRAQRAVLRLASATTSMGEQQIDTGLTIEAIRGA